MRKLREVKSKMAKPIVTQAIGKLLTVAKAYAEARKANREFYEQHINPVPKEEKIGSETYEEWEKLTKAQIDAEQQLKEAAISLAEARMKARDRER